MGEIGGSLANNSRFSRCSEKSRKFCCWQVSGNPPLLDDLGSGTGKIVVMLVFDTNSVGILINSGYLESLKGVRLGEQSGQLQVRSFKFVLSCRKCCDNQRITERSLGDLFDTHAHKKTEL